MVTARVVNKPPGQIMFIHHPELDNSKGFSAVQTISLPLFKEGLFIFVTTLLCKGAMFARRDGKVLTGQFQSVVLCKER